MPARIITPPCARYQSECRLTFSRIASRMTWAAASSDMAMIRLPQLTFPNQRVHDANGTYAATSFTCRPTDIILFGAIATPQSREQSVTDPRREWGACIGRHPD